jgi:hypothetical protein
MTACRVAQGTFPLTAFDSAAREVWPSQLTPAERAYTHRFTYMLTDGITEQTVAYPLVRRLCDAVMRCAGAWPLPEPGEGCGRRAVLCAAG